eukprot:CAMPEP_0119314202 /NCGR_PEP_ID=MMETSP1333-20130426/32059_1 /TAXON_ID=418940 /ORGANISM="Scyphosphaera apsteinii, Strain RCC1455" /LENGTH=885 /DNA_ID=CAMNT_0007319269 /DNA_START=95 /DNA_END=2749 /DNA_ORIENTATION=+
MSASSSDAQAFTITFDSEPIFLRPGESFVKGRSIPNALPGPQAGQGSMAILNQMVYVNKKLEQTILPSEHQIINRRTRMHWRLSRAIAIRSLEVALIHETGGVVKPTEAFLHHAVVYDGKGVGPMTCPIQSRWVFGGGHEMNGSPLIAFPPGYAYYTETSDRWEAELHVIDVRGVEADQLHACIQCACPGELGGTVLCCPDGDRCQTSLPDVLAEYRVRFTLLAIEAADAREAGVLSVMLMNHAIAGQAVPHKNLIAGHAFDKKDMPSYDAARDSAQQCLYEYDLPSACNGRSESECAFTTSIEWDFWPETLDVISFAMHVHVGAKSLAVLLDDTEVCRMNVFYGDPKSLRDPFRSPFINGTSKCLFAEPLRFTRGSKVKMLATYDIHLPRHGIMSFINMAAVEKPGWKHASGLVSDGAVAEIATEFVRMLPSRFKPNVRSFFISCFAPLDVKNVARWVKGAVHAAWTGSTLDRRHDSSLQWYGTEWCDARHPSSRQNAWPAMTAEGSWAQLDYSSVNGGSTMAVAKSSPIVPVSAIAAVMCIGDSWSIGHNGGDHSSSGGFLNEFAQLAYNQTVNNFMYTAKNLKKMGLAKEVVSIQALEERGLSFGCGDGRGTLGEKIDTLATLIAKFSPALKGMSSGSTSIRSPIERASGASAEMFNLNAASRGGGLSEVGASPTYLKQAETLTARAGSEFAGKWKVVTIQAPFSELAWGFRDLAAFEHATSTLLTFLNHSLAPALYVNLLGFPEHLSKQISGLLSPLDPRGCSKQLALYYGLMWFSSEASANIWGFDKIAIKMNYVLRALARIFNDERRGFIVRFQPITVGFHIPVDTVDKMSCFHSIARSQELIARGLWQNMVTCPQDELWKLGVPDVKWDGPNKVEANW